MTNQPRRNLGAQLLVYLSDGTVKSATEVAAISGASYNAIRDRYAAIRARGEPVTLERLSTPMRQWK